MDQLRKIILSLLLLFIVGGLTPAWAQTTTFPITIDPQGFGGQYWVYGTGGVAGASGIQMLNLIAGSYDIDIGNAGNCSRKTFVVNGDGTVSNHPTLDSSGALAFNGNTILFKTSTVNVDLGQFLGVGATQFNSTSNPLGTAQSSQVVVLDTAFKFRMFYSPSSVHFHVNANGDVGPSTCRSGLNGVVNPSDALILNGNTVQFKNTTVRLDPRQYSGSYGVHQTPSWGTGIKDVVLVPGFVFDIKLTSLDGFGVIWIHVRADGTVEPYSLSGQSNAGNQVDFDNTANPPAVQFRNVTVNFNPDQYQGFYYFDLSTPISNSPVFGPLSLVLVPDTKYEMRIEGLQNRIGYFVDVNGNMQGTAFGALKNSADLMDFQENTATFRNTRIFVNPSDSSTWRINNVTTSSGRIGSLQLTVVPKLSYTILDFDATNSPPTLVNNANFNVLSPCSIAPTGGVTIQNTFYSIVCVPMANAGADQTVNEEVLVSLNGTGSSFPSNGNPGYQWTQVGGPSVTLNDPTSPTPSFTSPSVSLSVGSQILTFQLIVNDGGAFSDADTVDITVVHVNKKPVADAGDNFNLREGATGHLDSSHSYDPDGDPLSGHTWTQTNGPAVSLQPSGNTAAPTFTAPLGNQTLLFQLRVSDGQLLSDLSAGSSAAATDTVQVTVGSNTAPVAHAGADQTVNESTQVQLDGTQSSDSDGDGLTYAWIQTGGSPIVSLTNPTSATPTFTAPLVGGAGATLTFSLIVTDDYAANPKASVADTVDVHVLNLNDPPRCDLAVPSLTAIWPPNHKMVEVTISGVTDPNTDPVTISITSVTQDEPVSGLGDGDTSPDAVVQNGSILLRAERAGTGNGRVYTVHFTANDGEGTCNGIVTVGVPRDRKDTAVNDGQSYNSLMP